MLKDLEIKMQKLSKLGVNNYWQPPTSSGVEYFLQSRFVMNMTLDYDKT